MKPLLAHLSPLPPFVCCAIAASHSPQMSLADLQRASKLSKRMVERLSCRIDWRGVDVDVASQFAQACGVDLVCSEKALLFVRRTMASSTPFSGLKGKRRDTFNRKMRELLALKKEQK